MVNYYEVLQIPRNATVVDIKRAYRKLALKWHPDKNLQNPALANKKFREVCEAYETLSDSIKRKRYDRHGAKGSKGDFADFEDSDLFRFMNYQAIIKEYLGTSFFDSFFADGKNKRKRKGRAATPYESSDSSDSSSESDDDVEILLNSRYSKTGPRGPKISFKVPSACSHPNNCRCGKRTTITTVNSNGKIIITKRVVENGKESVMTYEDGVLKSRTVNGVTQKVCSKKIRCS